MNFKSILLYLFLSFFLYSCNGKLPGADARKVPYDPKERVKRNLEQGKGFRLDDAFGGGGKAGNFEFASSNPLWQASLDTIDFMPLSSANYSGGILITDWYSDDQNSNESIKITIRFLSNEIQSNSIKIIVHNKKCKNTETCNINEIDSKIKQELRRSILAKAAQLEIDLKKTKK